MNAWPGKLQTRLQKQFATNVKEDECEDESISSNYVSQVDSACPSPINTVSTKYENPPTSNKNVHINIDIDF